MVTQTDIPDNTLIAEHRTRTGGFADSFMTRVPGDIPLSTYVEAFYTAPLFRTERLILRLAGHPSTDRQARDIARGNAERFAIWDRPVRRENELLIRQTSDATASWFMTRPEGADTLLYFGSALDPVVTGADRRPTLFRVMTGLHTLYSRLLLASAARRLRKRR